MLAVLIVHKTTAQQLQFSCISDQLSLPAQECYNVMQDSKGFIWISTEAGLCRYNGNYTKIFDNKNGLPERASYVVQEDNNGLLWILSSANRILNYRNDTLAENPLSKEYQNMFKNKLAENYCMTVINDRIYISSQNTTVVIDQKSKKIHQISAGKNPGHSFLKIGNNLVNIKRNELSESDQEYARKGNLLISISDGTKTTRLNIPFKNQDRESTWRILTAHNSDGEYFIAIGRKIIRIRADLSYSTIDLPYNVLTIYCDKDDDLWAGTLKGGIFCYSKSDYSKINMQNLQGISVSGVCVDKENGIWCTTLEKGVYFCRNKYVFSYSNIAGLNKTADLLKYEASKLIVSTEDNQLCLLQKDSIVRISLKLDNNNPVSDIVKTESGWLISGKNFIVRADNNYKTSEAFQNKGYAVGASQLAQTNEGRIFYIHYGELCEICGTKTVKRKSPLESGGKCIAVVDNRHLLFGCKNGLYRMSILPLTGSAAIATSHTEYPTAEISNLKVNISKILKDNEGRIWIVTKENGLYILGNNKLINVSKTLKIPSDQFFDITQDSSGTIWAGSNIGLIRITKNSRNPNGYESKLYNAFSGLPASQVYKVATDNQFIYLSTTEGIAKFAVATDLNDTPPPPLYLDTLFINNEMATPEQLNTLSYNRNSLRLKLHILSYKEINMPSFLYELTAANNAIIKKELVKGALLQLDNLAPDEYTLNIHGISSNGKKSESPLSFHFIVPPPFWAATPFISTCIIGGIFLLLLIIRQTATRVRKKEEEKTRLNKQFAELQLTALQAQMNPHFIFNAINSIQTSILNKESQEAYDYLAKFSKLIRMVLNNAKNHQLTLEKELEMLTLYIALEQMRFDNKFEFELSISESIDTYESSLPTMLIQPYIENAIWHGLMPLKNQRKGKLTLTIFAENDKLHIVIQDNGIGRNESMKIKKTPEHKSVGMQLTQERMKLLSQLPEYKNATILVSDLTDGSGNAAGTKIHIILPYSNN